jgi:trehalose 6-phosphate phosphatase
LTPIVERPELAEIPESTRRLLDTLAFQRRIILGIISGRALADLKDKVNVSGVIYAGNHGFEIEGPGWSFVNPLAEEIRPFFRAVSQLLTLALESTRGVFVENKGLSLSVHFRQMAEDKAGDMKQAFQKVVDNARMEKNFRVTHGKKVYELRPAVDWDKGKAISLLMKKYGKNGKDNTLPIYLGDDVTDEDGFRVVGLNGSGIAVYVGDDLSRTAAGYYLKSPLEVVEFLKKLLDFSQRGYK